RRDQLAVVHRQPESSQAGGQVLGGKAAGVGEEEVAAVGLAKSIEELGRSAKGLAALAARAIGQHQAAVDVEKQRPAARDPQPAGAHDAAAEVASIASTCAAGSTLRSSSSSSRMSAP